MEGMCPTEKTPLLTSTANTASAPSRRARGLACAVSAAGPVGRPAGLKARRACWVCVERGAAPLAGWRRWRLRGRPRTSEVLESEEEASPEESLDESMMNPRCAGVRPPLGPRLSFVPSPPSSSSSSRSLSASSSESSSESCGCALSMETRLPASSASASSELERPRPCAAKGSRGLLATSCAGLWWSSVAGLERQFARSGLSKFPRQCALRFLECKRRWPSLSLSLSLDAWGALPVIARETTSLKRFRTCAGAPESPAGATVGAPPWAVVCWWDPACSAFS
mmetsp:Transcript_13857/g.41886  ORF Transcript_13857/g.41886 Transcript_13857/m.41886 type:complete len:282 (+) Transcript_13857:1201-2046(+)